MTYRLGRYLEKKINRNAGILLPVLVLSIKSVGPALSYESLAVVRSDGIPPPTLLTPLEATPPVTAVECLPAPHSTLERLQSMPTDLGAPGSFGTTVANTAVQCSTESQDPRWHNTSAINLGVHRCLNVIMRR